MNMKASEQLEYGKMGFERTALIEEYKAITDLHKHFDTMNLNMMSTITAGVFVLWGIMLGDRSRDLPPALLIALSMVVFFVLSTWIRYMSIHRSIVVRKLARACEIESVLGMMQNTIFQYDDETRRLRRSPGAHGAELTIYLLLSFLGATVMTYGCLDDIAMISSVRPGLMSAISCLWYLIPVLLFQGLFAIRWSVLCRTLVVEVVPHYQLPANKTMRWLFIVIGGYRSRDGATAVTG